MHTNNENKSENSLYYTYRCKVHELLSWNDANPWVNDLWEMYTGFTLFSQEYGYDPRSHNRFVSFKDLVFYFQNIGKIGGGSKQERATGAKLVALSF